MIIFSNTWNTLKGLKNNDNATFLLVANMIGITAVFLTFGLKQNLFGTYFSNLLLITSLSYLIFKLILILDNFRNNIFERNTSFINLLFNFIGILSLISLLIKISVGNISILLNSYSYFNLFLIFIILFSVIIITNFYKDTYLNFFKNSIFALLLIYINIILSKTIYCEGGDEDNTQNNSHNNTSDSSKISENNNNITQPSNAASTSNVASTSNAASSSNVASTSSSNTDVNNQNTNGGNKVEIHGHFHGDNVVKNAFDAVSKVASHAVSQTITQIGLAGGVGAGMTAGVKISKGQPLGTRMLTTAGMGLAGGATQLVLGTGNRMLNGLSVSNNLDNIANSNSPNRPNTPDSPDSPNEFILNSPYEEWLNLPDLSQLSDLELFLGGLVVLSGVNVIFLINLLLIIISKYVLSLDYEFNWVLKILPGKIGERVRLFLISYVKLLSKLRLFNLIIFIFILIFTTSFITYNLGLFYLNLEGFCKIYLNSKLK